MRVRVSVAQTFIAGLLVASLQRAAVAQSPSPCCSASRRTELERRVETVWADDVAAEQDVRRQLQLLQNHQASQQALEAAQDTYHRAHRELRRWRQRLRACIRVECNHDVELRL